MTRAQQAGLAVITAVALASAAAPWLATNPPGTMHTGLIFAPPMPPRVITNSAGLAPPFIYPLAMVDRLTRTFAEDRARPARIAFFSDGRLLSTPDATWLPLGGDSYGRDVYARVLAGGRLSLGVAGMAALLTLAIGALAGAIAGQAGGATDRAISGIADFVIVLPVLYALVTLRAVLPLNLETPAVFWTMVGVMAAVTWPMPAKGVRGIVAVERTKGYVEAAYAAGAGPLRILLRHVLPATRGYLAAQGLLLFPAFIFAEATLSFVGLGFADQTASWGSMLREASRVSAMTEAPWLLAPAGAIVLTVIGVHLVTTKE